jgi:hypothetical protein
MGGPLSFSPSREESASGFTDLNLRETLVNSPPQFVIHNWNKKVKRDSREYFRVQVLVRCSCVEQCLIWVSHLNGLQNPVSVVVLKAVFAFILLEEICSWFFLFPVFKNVLVVNVIWLLVEGFMSFLIVRLSYSSDRCNDLMI